MAELEARDWRPFRWLAERSSSWIMVGHATVTAIDPDSPASLSRRIVQHVLRRGWGFRGVLITDDLTMRAVYGRGICRAAIEALAAGIDLLLVSYDWTQYYRAMACALRQRAG
jgi:beta-N-acetylhexosaminidase